MATSKHTSRTIEFDEVSVCPHCGALTEEKFSGDEGWTFCSDGCGCLESDTLEHKFECPKCYELLDEPKCNCNMKPTPGPWHVEECDEATKEEIDVAFEVRHNNQMIADILIGNSNQEYEEQQVKIITVEEAKANAQLIAASPTLLDACKSCLESINQMVPNETLEGMKMILESAIAKAETI